MSKCSLLGQHLWKAKCSSSHLLIRKICCSASVVSISNRRKIQHASHSTCIPSSKSFSDIPSSKSKVATSLKTHSCNCLRVEDVGQSVVLRGFVAYLRQDKFVLLRDAHGITQILAEDMSIQVKELTLESYVEVAGTVRRRPSGQENMALDTGEVEVSAERMTLLSRAPDKLPFLIRPHNMPKETLGLHHRHLHLRLPHLQRNLRLRSQMMKRMSDFLEDEAGFVNVTTPTLGPPTAGGAHLFMVPYGGGASAPEGEDGPPAEKEYYSLSQSPQTYKQLLMVAGMERYYQLAMCYRDETSRPDRQPEFMQLDLEMSDVTALDIQELVEQLVGRCWPDERYRDTAGPPPSAPFPRITYADAMARYGSDKPDTRFQWQLSDVTAVLRSDGCSAKRLTETLHQPHCSARAFVVPRGQKYLPKSVQRAWDEVARRDHQLSGVSLLGVLPLSSDPDKRLPGNGVLMGVLSRLLSEDVSRALVESVGAAPGDTVVLAAGPTADVLSLLGRLRLLVADALEASGVPVRDKTRRQFLWVVDFPLFQLSKDGSSLQSVHHAFTAPHPDDGPLLDTRPLEVRSQHYDLVCDGWEVGGGSVRIHDGALQRRVLQLLQHPPSDLAYFTHALDAGAPPHAGIALGVERLSALLCGAPSIRDVTAFPKTGDGRCLLTGAPAPVC